MEPRNPAIQQLRSARRPNADYAVDLRQWRVWRDGEGGDPDPTGDDLDKNGNGGGSVTFTAEQQAALDKIVNDRLKRDREKRAADEAKRLADARKKYVPEGADLSDEDIAQLVADGVAKREAAKTEADKAVEAKTKAEKDALALKEELEKERAERRLERRDNALKDALRTAGVVDDDKNPRTRRLMTLLKDERQADIEALQGDDGQVDEAKLKKLVTDAEAAYPEYFKAGSGRFIPGTGSHAGKGGTPEPGKAERESFARRTANRVRGS